MSTNVATLPNEPLTVDQQHQHLHEVHEHLRHASTSDSPEEIRERLRRAEFALQRHEQQGQAGR
jgi:hypothetical protein